MKRKVFSFFRIHAESAVARSSSGRAFHAVGPATENDLVPNFVRVRGTSYKTVMARWVLIELTVAT